MAWWIDESPWPGPKEQNWPIPKLGDLYKHPESGAVMGVVVDCDTSMAASLPPKVRVACRVLVSTEPAESYQDFVSYFFEDEVDWRPDAT